MTKLDRAIGIESSPLPETVTAVRSLRLLGGCLTVGVAEARAARTERRTAVFMVNQYVELASQRVDWVDGSKKCDTVGVVVVVSSRKTRSEWAE